MTTQTFYIGPTPDMTAPQHPRPLNSLVASARRIKEAKVGSSRYRFKTEDWQNDAWDMYDLVGEQRFLATTLANRLGQARLFIGRLPDAMSNEPVEVVATTEASASETRVDVSDTAETSSSGYSSAETDEEPIPSEVLLQVLESFGGSVAARTQMLTRLGLNLFVSGEGYLVGIPREYLDALEETEEADESWFDALEVDEAEEGEGIALESLEWRMLSTEEIQKDKTGDKVVLQLDVDRKVSVDPDEVYLFRVWRSHPRKAWEADSPTRSSLPVLRELVGLTMRIGADIDSRLAGAGILVVPQSAARAIRTAAGLPEMVSGADEDEKDPFVEALIEAMVTPINDRASASAVVPMVIVAPDEAADKFQHITFSTPFDKYASVLREEAIRRLALGQDAPPELLLGTAGMNHWGAWLVEENTVTTHIEPPLALICDALTTEFLWPVLEEQGYPRDVVRQYVIWYDVGHMIVRPNRASDAKDLFDAGAISAKSYRDAAGFDDSDAPTAELEEAKKAAEEKGTNPEEDALRKAAGLKAIELAVANPQLVIQPGLQAIAEQVYEVMKGEFSQEDAEPEPQPAALAQAQAEQEQADQPAPDDDTTSTIPQTEDDQAQPTPVGRA